MSACCQAGMVNNFADALVIALVPRWLVDHHASVATVGLVTGLYAAPWGLLQLPAGEPADRVRCKWQIVGGLLAEGLAVGWFVTAVGLGIRLGAAVVMGAATVALYPNLLTAMTDISHPAWRGESLGVYRLWRDAATPSVRSSPRAWQRPSG
ncbi:MAG TPA: MFS transporter [Acidimicrobiales bacterium]|jgi:MFS family permease|nr:MFS transporter [Acidimicrobiales bacterium]